MRENKIQNKNCYLISLVLSQSIYTIVKATQSSYIYEQKTGWLELLCLPLYFLLWLKRNSNFIHDDLLKFAVTFGINILSLYFQHQLSVLKFCIGYGLRMIFFGFTLYSVKILSFYYACHIIFIYFFLQSWSNVDVYLLGMNLIQITYYNIVSRYDFLDLENKLNNRKTKYEQIINHLASVIDTPTSIISKSHKSQKVKTIFITQSLVKLTQQYDNQELIKQLLNIVAEHFQSKDQIQLARWTSFDSLKEEKRSVKTKSRKSLNNDCSKTQFFFQNLLNYADAQAFQEKDFYSPRDGKLIDGEKLVRPVDSQTENQIQEQTRHEIIQKSETLDNQKILILYLIEKKNDGINLRAKINELENLHKYKDNLLATVSHDFKTPLNGMILITSFLEGITEDQQHLKYLDIIKKNAYMLQYMIHDIIDFSKMSKGLLSVNPQYFSLDGTINEVLELMRLQAQEKGIELIYQNNYVHDELHNDPNRLKQVLINLMSNSLKFTPSGRITVQIQEPQSKTNMSQSIKDIQRNSLKITITDTGVGIPDDIKPKLFNMWATYDHNNGSNKNGAGLGLVICQKIVGLLGPTNRIELDSYVGVGTSMSFQIYVSLPLEKSSDKGFSSRALTLRDIRRQSIWKNDDLKIAGLSRVNSFNQSQIFQHQKPYASKGVTPTPRNQYQSDPSIMFEQVVEIDSEEEEMQEDSKGDKIYNLNTINIQTKVIKSLRVKQTVKKQKNVLKESVKLSMSKHSLQQSQHYISQNDVIYKLLSQGISDKQINILVVDDEVFNVMALKLALQKFSKLKIDEAFDGRQAIQQIEQKKLDGQYYKCIFMDLNMGVMDGFTAGKLIRQKVESQQIPPLCMIALSGHDDDKEKENCLKIGFDGFLPKPFNLGDLIDLLQDLRYVSETYGN